MSELLNDTIPPSIALKWLALGLCMWEVSGSNKQDTKGLVHIYQDTWCLIQQYFSLNYFLSFSDVTREITLDEKFKRASIAGARRPYQHFVTLSDRELCESFQIYLQVREKCRSLLLS